MNTKIFKLTALALAGAMLLSSCANEGTEEADIKLTSITTSATETSTTTTTAATTTTVTTESNLTSSGVVNTKIDYDFSDEDKELQEIISGIIDEAMVYVKLYTAGASLPFIEIVDGMAETITMYFPESDSPDTERLYSLLSETLPFTTIEELRAGYHQYFSEDIANEYMNRLYDNYLDEDGNLISPSVVIESNGRLYRSADGGMGVYIYPDYDMVKVISKTDDEIIFSYLCYTLDYVTKLKCAYGILVNEDGTWKFGWDLQRPYLL